MSRSGFDDYLSRQAHPVIDAEGTTLIVRIQAIATKTRSSYGSRRMAKALQEEDFQVGRYKVRRLMKDAGVVVRRRNTRKSQTTDSRHGYGVAPNVLDRQFDVDEPNVAWASDLTYVWTKEDWLYLAVLLDLYSQQVVGWSLGSRMDVGLVKGALEMAIGRRRPAPGLIHHTDRGSQYACHAYRDMLSQYGMVCSMSGKGECLDNAVAERFFGSLKRE